jgi:hypothetical protein
MKKNSNISVFQDWVYTLTFMQQSVLIASVRGPDGINKDHCAKVLIRWLRRSFLVCAFEKIVHNSPDEPCGGSFTGPSLKPRGFSHLLGVTQTLRSTGEWAIEMHREVREYLRHVDELPHHFQLHFMHAAEILGYKHPDEKIRNWWHQTYQMLVNDMHLSAETEEDMDKRLGDSEEAWRAREEVTAK